MREKAVNPFILKDGKKIFTIEELIVFLSNTDDYLYHYYVNDQKNDFSSWIEHELGSSELAESIRYKGRENAVRTLIRLITPVNDNEINGKKEYNKFNELLAEEEESFDPIDAELKKLEKDFEEVEEKIRSQPEIERINPEKKHPEIKKEEKTEILHEENKKDTDENTESPESVIVEDSILKTKDYVDLKNPVLDDDYDEKEIEYEETEIENNDSSINDKLKKFRQFKEDYELSRSKSKNDQGRHLKSEKEKKPAVSINEKSESEVRKDSLSSVIGRINEVSDKVEMQSKLLHKKHSEIEKLREALEQKSKEHSIALENISNLKKKEKYLQELEINTKKKIKTFRDLFNKVRKVLKDKDITFSQNELELLNEESIIEKRKGRIERKSRLSDIDVDDHALNESRRNLAIEKTADELESIEKLEDHISKIEDKIEKVWNKYSIDVIKERDRLKRF